MPRRVRCAAVLFVLAGAFAGCGSDESEGLGPERAGTTLQPSGTSAPVTPIEREETGPPPTEDGAPADPTEAAILEAVDGYWRTLAAASDPPDPSHPDLDRYLAGEALELSRSVLASQAAAGQAVLAPPGGVETLEVRIHLGDDGLAIIDHCIRDTADLVDAMSGEIIRADHVVKHIQIALSSEMGSWKVTETASIARFPVGADRCDSMGVR